METNKKNSLKQLGIIAAVLLALNIFGNYFFKRFDLTKDNRYTLSETTLGIIESVDSPLYIDVFLEGKFPPEFKRLQNETRQLLEEFTAYNWKKPDFITFTASDGAEVKARLYTPETEVKNNVFLNAYLDIVLKDTISGHIIIIDLKTSTKGWSKYQKNDKVKTSQMLIYKKFYSELCDVPLNEIKVEYHILKSKIRTTSCGSNNYSNRKHPMFSTITRQMDI